MLCFLLDEHLSTEIASIVKSMQPRIGIASVLDWEDGTWRGLSDADLLRAAREAELTLVSYDQRTIPTLLEAWALSGEAHAGVVFVSRRTIIQQDVGTLAKAIVSLWMSCGELDWTNRLAYLRRPE